MSDEEEQRSNKGVDETTAAWAAGVIDAFGRFSVIITTEGRYDVALDVSLPNVSVYEQVKALTRLVTFFGGRLITGSAERELYKASVEPLYTWRIPGHVLRTVLPAFARFMVLQVDQASIASDLFGRTELEREDDFVMSPEELDARADLHLAMETANRRRYG